MRSGVNVVIQREGHMTTINNEEIERMLTRMGDAARALGRSMADMAPVVDRLAGALSSYRVRYVLAWRLWVIGLPRSWAIWIADRVPWRILDRIRDRLGLDG